VLHHGICTSGIHKASTREQPQLVSASKVEAAFDFPASAMEVEADMTVGANVSWGRGRASQIHLTHLSRLSITKITRIAFFN